MKHFPYKAFFQSKQTKQGMSKMSKMKMNALVGMTNVSKILGYVFPTNLTLASLRVAGISHLKEAVLARDINF